MKPVPAVFLDRDGTLNVDTDFVHRPDEWQWIPGAVDALRRFNALGLKVVVVSNQAGVARGKYGEEDVRRLHAWVAAGLEKDGVRVDAFYFCPHHPEHGGRVVCDCRKPKPGMLLQAQRELGIDLSRSFMVGDKEIDVRTGLAAGVTPLLVLTGHGGGQRGKVPPGTAVVADIAEARRWIEERIH